MATNNDLRWVITSKPEWTDVTPMEGQGDMQVNVTIHEDVGDPAETAGTITVTCTSCKEQKQRQISVCRCTCNCDRLSIVWEIDTINQTGMSSNTRIGTYTINGACTEDNISARIKKRGSSGTGTALSLSNGIITTTRKISANTTPNEIYYDITVAIKNGDACDRLSHEMRQEGIICECNTVLNSVTFNNIPQEGLSVGAQVGSYTLKTDYQCSTDKLSAILSGDDIEYSLVMNNNKINLQPNEGISPNTEPHSKTFYYTVKYNGDECSSETKNQPGISCTCETIFVENSFAVTIPNEGYEEGAEIGSYELTEIGRGCPESKISATLSDADTTYELICENEKVMLPSDKGIPENTNANVKKFNLTVMYEGDSEPCDSEQIEQPGTGSVVCSCDSIEYFVKSTKRTFPMSGTGSQWVSIGSGDTVGCGVLSATSDTDMLFNNNVKVTEIGEDKYDFSVRVLENTGAPRSCGVRLYFKKYEDPDFDKCDMELILTQDYNYCDCEEFPMFYYGDLLNRVMDCSKHDDIHAVYFINAANCYSLKVRTNEEWMTVHGNNYIDVAENNGNYREGVIYVDKYVDVNEDGTGGILCGTEEKIVKQEKCLGCDCNNNGFNKLGYPYEIMHTFDLDRFANTMTYNFTLDCGELRYSFVGDTPDWLTVNIDNEEKTVTITVLENIGSLRSASVLFYPFIDGHECENTITFKYNQYACNSCENIDHIIPNNRNCLLNETEIVARYSGPCSEFSISATTESEYVYGITGGAKSVSAKFAYNDTSQKRYIPFTAFLMLNGERIDGCEKTFDICQDYEICNCDDYYYSISTVGCGNVFNVGSGSHKVGKISSSSSLPECLTLSADSTHTGATNHSLNRVWLEGDEVWVEIADTISTSSQPTTIDINVIYEGQPCEGEDKHQIIKIDVVDPDNPPNNNS